MMSPEETRRVLKHLRDAYEGAKRAAQPVDMYPDAQRDIAKAARLRDENQVRADIIWRMIDALNWSIGQPSELAEWIEKWDKADRIAKQGFAGRLIG